MKTVFSAFINKCYAQLKKKNRLERGIFYFFCWLACHTTPLFTTQFEICEKKTVAMIHNVLCARGPTAVVRADVRLLYQFDVVASYLFAIVGGHLSDLFSDV